MLRSLLFVPGDSPAKLAGGARHGADALILDLEDSVAPARKVAARELVSDYLRRTDRAPGVRCYVRINAVQSGEAWHDLAAVLPARPDGIVLPKSEPALLAETDREIDRLQREAGAGAGPRPLRVIAIATETAAALFGIGHYRGVSARLEALTWGGEDLAAELGAVNRDEHGYTDTFRLARSLCVLGASAADVTAIDGACMDYQDLAALERECREGRRAGFTGKLAIHPRQVAVINDAFTPSEAEVGWAKRVVAAFASQPELGVVGIDGKVIDRPHLRLAERMLARL
jgi:citrate lyase subunit beta/citryl-CoA lyase